jgi:hypothetical protein
MFTAFVLKKNARTPGHLRSEGVITSHIQRENIPPFFLVTRGEACEAGFVMVVMAVMAVGDGGGGDGDGGDVDGA